MTYDLATYVKAIVDKFPPLTDVQRNQIAALLRPAPVIPVGGSEPVDYAAEDAPAGQLELTGGTL